MMTASPFLTACPTFASTLKILPAAPASTLMLPAAPPALGAAAGALGAALGAAGAFAATGAPVDAPSNTNKTYTLQFTEMV